MKAHLHVKLSHKGNLVPLPDWFRSNNNCRLTYVSMLDNLASHISEIVLLKFSGTF